MVGSCLPVVVVLSPGTDAEYDALAAAYVAHAGDRPAIIAAFREVSDRHTDAAVDIAAQSCRELDTTVHESTGLKDHAAGLLDALNAIEPGRFASGKMMRQLDALLASIL